MNKYSTLEYDHVRIESCCFEADGGIAEYHATLHATRTNSSFVTQLDDLQNACVRLLSCYGKHVRPVFKRYFLSDAANQAPLLAACDKDAIPCAVSIVQQPPLDGSKIALWVYLKPDTKITAFPHGISDEHNGYRHIWTAGRIAAGNDSFRQTESLFQEYTAALKQMQCRLDTDCLRTWLFVQDIDRNYGGVVKARKAFFAQHQLTEQTHYIVSTGIEARHAVPETLVSLDAYAVRGLQPGQLRFLSAPTHLNPAHEYGVTFERGVCVEYGDRRHVFIAGTASINNKGEIVHPDDITGQTLRMLENIEVLLAEAGTSFNHVVQMIVYLRDLSDYRVVNALFEARFPALPKVITLAPVCRHAWLVETECIAIRQQHHPQFRAL
ncbi:MAG: hypothetical protein LBT83_11770 [Tannerella sp.]|jgi:enamine deaminase RidA (YjgF/YER057c/UK114 family)|nr:hypothetical protein [Tannerella sp.]